MSEILCPDRSVLVVDDEAQALKSVEMTLRAGGIRNVLVCPDSREVVPLLSTHAVEVILLDLTMPHISGEALLTQVTRGFPEIPVIIITANDTADTAVRCMKANAFDYLVKPVEKNRLLEGVRRAIEVRRLADENDRLKEGLSADTLCQPEAFSEIVTRDRAMRSLFQYVESISGSPLAVLITGETGVGKELMARAVHALSNRRGPFIPVNVAGIDDTTFSDTLFGHVKGAFTGAHENRTGLVEKAAGGTLLLDEIGDLHPGSQIKLLRLLQEQEYLPLGSDTPKRSDARIIATTNQDLKALMQSGRFRNDLYFRLRAHHLQIPPLRDRRDDLPLLVAHFMTKAAQALGKKRPTCPETLMTLLRNYPFPGNVRELWTMVHDAVGSHTAGVVSLDRFKAHIQAEHTLSAADPASLLDEQNLDFAQSGAFPTLRQANRLLIAQAMKRTGNNQTLAADLLGISRQTLNRQLKSISP